MAADRAQHVMEVIRPALAAGRDVVCDRYLHSSLAYQGYGRGLPVAEIRALSLWATEGLVPDAVVLLDVPAAVTAERLGSDLDRFEAEGDGFHRRVVAGFAELAAAEPDLVVVVDGDGDPDEVEERVRGALEGRGW
jgi:dTMP kinase